MAHENLTYDDLLRIVELIKSTEHFSEFRLKVGDIELELRHRKSGASAPVSAPVKAGAIESTVRTGHSGRRLPLLRNGRKVRWLSAHRWSERFIAHRNPAHLHSLKSAKR